MLMLRGVKRAAFRPEVPAGQAKRRLSAPLPLWRALHRYGYAEQAGAPPALAQAPERQPERDHDGQRAQRHPPGERPGHAPAGLDRVCLAEQRVVRSRSQQGDDSDGLGDDHLEPCACLPCRVGGQVPCPVGYRAGGSAPAERRAGRHPVAPGRSRCRRIAGPGSAVPWRGRGPQPPPARRPSTAHDPRDGALHDHRRTPPNVTLTRNLAQSGRLRRTSWPPRVALASVPGNARYGLAGDPMVARVRTLPRNRRRRVHDGCRRNSGLEITHAPGGSRTISGSTVEQGEAPAGSAGGG